MRTLFMTLLLTASLFAPPVFADDVPDRIASGHAFYAACISSREMAGMPNASNACYCETGYLAGILTERQMYIVARIAPNDIDMQTEFTRLEAEGYSREEIGTAVRILVNVGSAGDHFCEGL